MRKSSGLKILTRLGAAAVLTVSFNISAQAPLQNATKETYPLVTTKQEAVAEKSCLGEWAEAAFRGGLYRYGNGLFYPENRDSYMHCRINCEISDDIESAQCAKKISDQREKNEDDPLDGAEDQAANYDGRQAGLEGKQCNTYCEKYLPAQERSQP